jgi:hypothetical protein
MKTRIFEFLAVLSICIAILLPLVSRKTMRNRIPEILAGLSIFIAILLLVHQQVTTNDPWFDWPEFWSHESLIACFVSLGVGSLLGKYLGRIRV